MVRRVQLLDNKKFEVRISDKIGAEKREAIFKNIGAAIAKINEGAAQKQITAEEIEQINSMKAIEVRSDISRPGMQGSTFWMKQSLSETPDLDWITGVLLHESFHAEQNRRGEPSSGIPAEMAASAFAAPIAKRIGLSSSTVEALERDTKTGHKG